MKSGIWRPAVAALVLAAVSGQAAAYGGRGYHHRGHYHRGHSNSGLWIGGAALLGAGVALAVSSSRPRYGGTVVYTTPPPVYYNPPVYVAPPPVAYTPPAVYAAPPVYVPPPVAYAAPPAPSGDVVAYPAQGQNEARQAQDRQECSRWAMNQSGYDPAGASQWTTSVSVDSYNRALGACFKGRGYSIN